MNQLIASDQCSLIVGGGATGLSVARYFEKTGRRYRVYDTRPSRDVLKPFLDINAQLHCWNGAFDPDCLLGVDEVVLSPGVPRDSELVTYALAKNLVVRGDIALFLEQAKAPVIGITGSNGKSSVTTLVGMAAAEANMNVAVGGNIGVPALDLLADAVDLYVLELSSFQLESTDNPGLRVAANLNVSPDHMDRHGSMMTYFGIKQKIFHQAQAFVYNLNDPLTQPPVVEKVKRFGFGLSERQEKNEVQYFLDAQQEMLCREGKPLISRELPKIKGLHNIENILAAFAIAEAADIAPAAVECAVKKFAGLHHRCEFVRELEGVAFINDSKATNVGATVAALQGLSREYATMALIVGGESKGADFGELVRVIDRCVDTLVLIGVDADKIKKLLPSAQKYYLATSMQDAVQQAFLAVRPQGLVLLSPACASFDMYKNFQDRGDDFKKIVMELAA